jgi:hypothetical protein
VAERRVGTRTDGGRRWARDGDARGTRCSRARGGVRAGTAALQGERGGGGDARARPVGGARAGPRGGGARAGAAMEGGAQRGWVRRRSS